MFIFLVLVYLEVFSFGIMYIVGIFLFFWFIEYVFKEVFFSREYCGFGLYYYLFLGIVVLGVLFLGIVFLKRVWNLIGN